jgi:hypothetical protein
MLAERERGNSPANKDAKQSQRNIARRSRGEKTKDSLSDITHTSSSISRRFKKEVFYLSAVISLCSRTRNSVAMAPNSNKGLDYT